MTTIDKNTFTEPKERSLLFYLVPSTLIGFGLAAAVIVTAPVGAVIAAVGIVLSTFA